MANIQTLPKGGIAIQYGWYRVNFACSWNCYHFEAYFALAAFRIASNMRKKHPSCCSITTWIFCFAKEGSGKLKIDDEAAASARNLFNTSITGYGTIDCFTVYWCGIVCLFIFDWKFGIAAH